MLLYKELVAANDLKVPAPIIPQKSTPEKSCASHAKEEVSESTARTNKGKGKVEPRDDLPSCRDDRRYHFEDREPKFARPTIGQRETVLRPRVWDRLGGKVTQSERGQPQN